MDTFWKLNWKRSTSLLSWNMQRKAILCWVFSCVFTLLWVFILQVIKSDPVFSLHMPGRCYSLCTCLIPLHHLSCSAESEHLDSGEKYFWQNKTLSILCLFAKTKNAFHIILFMGFGVELFCFVLLPVNFSRSVKQYEGCTQLLPTVPFVPFLFMVTWNIHSC